MHHHDSKEVIYFGEIIPETRIHARASRVRNHNRSRAADSVMNIDSVEYDFIFACIKLRHITSSLDTMIILIINLMSPKARNLCSLYSQTAWKFFPISI